MSVSTSVLHIESRRSSSDDTLGSVCPSATASSRDMVGLQLVIVSAAFDEPADVVAIGVDIVTPDIGGREPGAGEV